MRLVLPLVAACSADPGSKDAGTGPTDGPSDPTTPTTPADTDPTAPTVDTAPPATTPTGDTGTSTTTSALGNPSVSGSCDGYAVDSWLSGLLTVPELQIFGIYESDGGHGGPPGNLTLEIDRPVQMTVVLSSYEPVDYTIVVHPGAVVDEVIVNGYYAHTVTVTDAYGVALAVPVDNHSPYTNGWFGRIPFSTSGGYYLSETTAFIADMEAYTGLDATAFWGCYHATGFRLQ